MVIKPGTKRVLLCGGPADCQTVDAAESAISYVFTEVKEERLTFRDFTDGRLSMPAYTTHRYQIIGQHASGLFVAVHEDIDRKDYGAAAEHTLKKAGLFTPDTAQWWRANPIVPAGNSLGEARKIREEFDKLFNVRKVKEPAPVDDGLTRITIETRKPDKWRFIDTETGETWRWDMDQNKFVKVVYTHE